MKQGDLKLIQFEVAERSVSETQLFDLPANPNELLDGLNNLGPLQLNHATAPAYAKKLADMQTLLLDQMRQHDDPYRFSNQPSDDLQMPPKRATQRTNAKGKK